MALIAQPNAIYIAIGSEIINGETSEKNAKPLAILLKNGNINLCEISILPDEVGMISRSVSQAKAKYDYVFISGGIGIEERDVTAIAIAKTFEVEMILNPLLLSRLKKKYQDKFKSRQNPKEIRLAYLPSGAEIIENKLSDVPGFVIDNVYVLPGNPKVFMAMSEQVKKSLKHNLATFSHAAVFHIQEPFIKDIISFVDNKYSNVSISSHPFISCGMLGCEISLKSKHKPQLEAALETLNSMIQVRIEQKNKKKKI